MQSHHHVQQVWDSFVTHLKGLSESLHTAHEVFTQPEEDIKGMSLTTLKRRKHKSLESLSKGKENVDHLLMQASQVYSATSHWQSQIDAADATKQEALMLLASVKNDLQDALHKVHVLETGRQRLTADMDAAHQQAAEQEAEIRSLRCQTATLTDDSETAHMRAAKAESRMHELNQETQQLLDSEAQALQDKQAATSIVDTLKAEAAEAKAVAGRHQDMVASLTADNLVFLMRLKKCEGDLVSAVQERDELRLAVEEQRGPWFDEMKAGVEARVRAVMSGSNRLQAQLDSSQALHDAQLSSVEERAAQLQEQLRDHQQQLQVKSQEVNDAQEALDRSQEAMQSAEGRLAETQQQVDKLAAENRVLMESSGSMRRECNEAWIKQEAACGKVDGLHQEIQALKEESTDLQRLLAERDSQLEQQLGMNQQLMKRKEDMEWQLMSVLAQGSKSKSDTRTSVSGPHALADRTNQNSTALHRSGTERSFASVHKQQQPDMLQPDASLQHESHDWSAKAQTSAAEEQQLLPARPSKATRAQRHQQVLGVENYAVLGTSGRTEGSSHSKLHDLDLNAEVQAHMPVNRTDDGCSSLSRRAPRLSISSQDHALHHTVAQTYATESSAHVTEPSPGRKVFAAEVLLTRPHMPASPA